MTHPLPAGMTGRIKWFSQLTAALDEAQYLLAQLSIHGDDPAEAAQARTQIIALSCEIELLRCEGFLAQQRIASESVPPNWRGNRA